jgi:hypothetical protein
MYARLLRHLHVSQGSALLRALAAATCNCGSNVDGIGDLSGAGGESVGDSALRRWAPQLTLLHVQHLLSNERLSGRQPGEIKGEVRALRRQAPLAGIIDVHLADLRCYLTDAVLNQLIALYDPEALAVPLAQQ